MSVVTVYLPDLARVWLAEKSVSARTRDPKNSEAAREDDLCRFARCLMLMDHREPADGPFDLDVDLGEVPVHLWQYSTVMRALSAMKSRFRPSTMARTVSTTRQFTRWLHKRGVLAADPFEDVKVASPPSTVLPFGKFFSDDELDAMRAAAAHPLPSAWSAWPARDVAILELLVGCGTRAQELASLRVQSLDRSGEYPMLRITTGSKGDKPRDVPVPRRALTAVDEYLRERRQRAGTEPAWEFSDTSPLFVVHRRTGNVRVCSIDRMWLYRLVERLTAAAGVAMKPDAAVHAFRHAYGVSLARRKVSPFLIAQLMGHSDLRTTAGYTRFNGDLVVEGLVDAGWL